MSSKGVTTLVLLVSLALTIIHFVSFAIDESNWSYPLFLSIFTSPILLKERKYPWLFIKHIGEPKLTGSFESLYSNFKMISSSPFGTSISGTYMALIMMTFFYIENGMIPTSWSFSFIHAHCQVLSIVLWFKRNLYFMNPCFVLQLIRILGIFVLPFWSKQASSLLIWIN